MPDKFNELLCCTQSIFNYNSLNIEIRSEKSIIWEIIHKNKVFTCPVCGHNVTIFYRDGSRDITGLILGNAPVILRVHMHRIKCLECNKHSREQLDFVQTQKSRYTKAVAQKALKLRSVMTISDVSRLLGISWVAVKDIELAYLKEKYKTINMATVKSIGIDEIWTGRSFLTIVRDMDDGRTLYVGEGKDGSCLNEFEKQLKAARATIKHVCIDMGAVYTKWAKDKLPGALIIYDKFHLIKLMNEKLSLVRRETMNSLDLEEKKELKGKRFLLARNEEDLERNSKEQLDIVREQYKAVGEASIMKECLRRVYRICVCSTDAEYALKYWANLAKESGISALKTMAKTVTQKMKGIIAYFDTGLTSASMEGFNNKIGWMTRMAYGYSDIEYLKLKIYDLPHLKKRLEEE